MPTIDKTDSAIWPGSLVMFIRFRLELPDVGGQDSGERAPQRIEGQRCGPGAADFDRSTPSQVRAADGQYTRRDRRCSEHRLVKNSQDQLALRTRFAASAAI